MRPKRTTSAKSRLIKAVPPRGHSFYRLADAGATDGLDVRFPRLTPATFIERPNRFLVIAQVGRHRVRAASRDPGRLRELLVPGAQLLLAPSAGPGRRTAYTVVLVHKDGTWVSVIPVLANRLFEAALLRHGAVGLEGARILDREVARGHSRFDFLLSHHGRRILTEVKSATLVESRCALFPDAPTARGTRHVAALTGLGRGALVVFVVQRPDASRLTLHAGHDPAFAGALADAVQAGVGVLAYACRVSPEGATLDRPIPVVL